MKNHLCALRTALLASAALLLAAGLASATSYTVWIKTIGYIGHDDEASGPDPVSIEGSGGHPTGWYVYDIASTPGTENIDVLNHSQAHSGLLDGKQADSQFLITDFVITDGTGISKPVTCWLNLEVLGTASLVGEIDTTSWGCVGGHTSGIVNGQSQAGDWHPEGGDWNCGYASSGIFAAETGETIAGTFTFGPFSVSSENPFAVGINSSLQVAPEVGPGGGWMDVHGTFRSGFASLTPVFTLPEGFTANSATASVVDNWYVGSPTAAPDLAHLGSGASLAQNAPNPFADATTIAFTLTGSSRVSLRVLDVAGRLVADLVEGERGAGRHTATWNGRDTTGRRVPAGVYFYRIESADGGATRKMTLLR